jgi:cell cycle arrest protein BUB3
MKFMTRAVACMPDDSGYASSSTEGRVSVEWFDPSEESQRRKTAFKCHRVTEADGTDTVYPVNALAFHPERNVFASRSGDGLVSLWDAMAKRRIKQYQKFGSSVVALGFSCDGHYLAIATSPGFEDGKEPDQMEGLVKVVIRELAPLCNEAWSLSAVKV